MVTVDRDRLLLDTKEWLPSSSTLSDSMILAINETVILSIGDDDTFYPQIRCECLRANATKLMVEYSIQNGGLKREKVGQVEAEYYNSTTINPWKDYLSNLYSHVCPLFGYIKPIDDSANYSPMTTVVYNNTLTEDFTADCTCSSDLTL